MHPYTVLFARGTLARLALWSTLRLAVHASWGGPDSAEKQRWLVGILVDQFEPFLVSDTTTTSPPDALFIETILFQIMADEFDVVLEDDSPASVARDLVRLFDEIRRGETAFVHLLEEQADRVKGIVPPHQISYSSASEGSSDSQGEWEDDEGESEGEQAPPLLDHSVEEPQVDEDGFTLVKKKGRR